jgi:hypothetical protein
LRIEYPALKVGLVSVGFESKLGDLELLMLVIESWVIQHSCEDVRIGKWKRLLTPTQPAQESEHQLVKGRPLIRIIIYDQILIDELIEIRQGITLLL